MMTYKTVKGIFGRVRCNNAFITYMRHVRDVCA